MGTMSTLIEIKDKFADAQPNIEILDNEYHGSKYKLTFRCMIDGYEWKANYHTMLKSKYACKECFLRNVSGDNSVNWNGGVTEIHSYLRRGSYKWKSEALKRHDKCQISGVDFDLEVHHLAPAFHVIAKKVFENTNIDVREKVSDYTEKELNKLLAECEKLHENCIPTVWNKTLHKAFHRIYKYPENSIYQSTMFATKVYRECIREEDITNDMNVLKNRLRDYLYDTRDEVEVCNDLIVDYDKQQEKLREERIRRQLIKSNNFFGKLHGVRAEDFYKCLDKRLRTYEERLESVNKMFYPNGNLHPYWIDVFDQPEGERGHINLLLNSADKIYSESNIAVVLNAVGTYLLEPFMDEKDDTIEYKIYTDYRLFKEALRHISFDHVTSEDNSDYFEIENQMIYYKEIKNHKKSSKQGINPSDYADPEIGKLLMDYRKVSDEITLKKNMIRDLRELSNEQIMELDDLYRAYISDSNMGIPIDNMWYGDKSMGEDYYG